MVFRLTDYARKCCSEIIVPTMDGCSWQQGRAGAFFVLGGRMTGAADGVISEARSWWSADAFQRKDVCDKKMVVLRIRRVCIVL